MTFLKIHCSALALFAIAVSVPGCSLDKNTPERASVVALTAALEPAFDEELTPQAAVNDYAVFSQFESELRARAMVGGANFGSNNRVELGHAANVWGDVIAGSSVVLAEKARVYGDVSAGDHLRRDASAEVSGSITDDAHSEPLSFPITELLPGKKDLVIGHDDALPPGNYGQVRVLRHATLRFSAGQYVFAALRLSPLSHLAMAAAPGSSIRVHTAFELDIGDGASMTLEQGAQPISIQFTSAQAGLLRIGSEAKWFGLLRAPRASIDVGARAYLAGAVYGRTVTLEPGSTVCRPPILQGFTHSEDAYAPAFGPYTTAYRAVVPAEAQSLTVTPLVAKNVRVTVAGQAGGAPVALSADTSEIAIELREDSCQLSSRYVLQVTRSADYAIRVDDDSPAAPAAQDGRSWATAYRDLARALGRAGDEGREIWLAQGVYHPRSTVDSRWARDATFSLSPGLEVRGGFVGSEVRAAPTGSPYATILSGDLANNDSGLSAWPAASAADRALLRDNVHHVLTVAGESRFVGPTLSSLTVVGGIADGRAANGLGGGVLIKEAPPRLEGCIFNRNFALRAGGGLYALGGPATVKDSLFSENVVEEGDGGAVCLKGAPSARIETTVFNLNRADKGSGGALQLVATAATLENVVLVSNAAERDGAALNVEHGNAVLNSATIVSQVTANADGSVLHASKGSSITVQNSVLWNERVQATIAGSGIRVSSSCVAGGASGDDNVAAVPTFVDAAHPAGTDGVFGSSDDGLAFAKGSTCIDIGNDAVAPKHDLLLISRPWGPHADPGAYEYEEYQSQQGLFGKLVAGAFQASPDVPVLRSIYHARYAALYAASTFSRVLRIAVPKNDQTRDRSSGYLYLRGKDSAGAYLRGSVPIQVAMYRTGDDSTNVYFQSSTPTSGKPILFVDSPVFQDAANPYAYIVYAEPGTPVEITIPIPQ